MKNFICIVITLLLVAAILAMPVLLSAATSGNNAWRNLVDPKILAIMESAEDDELIAVSVLISPSAEEIDARTKSFLNEHKDDFVAYMRDKHIEWYVDSLEWNLAYDAEQKGIEIDDFGIEVNICDGGFEVKYLNPLSMEYVTRIEEYDRAFAMHQLSFDIRDELLADGINSFIEEHIGERIDDTNVIAFDGSIRRLYTYWHIAGVIGYEAHKNEIIALAMYFIDTKTNNQIIYFNFDSINKPIYIGNDSERIKGDVNGDGSVDLADMLALRDIIFGADAAPDVPLVIADINGDSAVDIADLLALRDIIFDVET